MSQVREKLVHHKKNAPLLASNSPGILTSYSLLPSIMLMISQPNSRTAIRYLSCAAIVGKRCGIDIVGSDEKKRKDISGCQKNTWVRKLLRIIYSTWSGTYSRRFVRTDSLHSWNHFNVLTLNCKLHTASKNFISGSTITPDILC